MSTLTAADFSVVGMYLVVLLALAGWISRRGARTTDDYFLAGKHLPWWAVGASLIAANISAEQIIGMSGSGYAIGLAIASYEWMAALTLLIVGKYLLPVLLRANISTMPQYLQQRFDGRVRVLLAVFWLGVYVLVNLTSVLWLGALALSTISGLSMDLSLWLLAVLALLYSLYGGLKAVAYTDIIQVVILVAGGLLLTYLTLQLLTPAGDVWAGWQHLLQQAPAKFDLVLAPEHPAYAALPGISVVLGGMWVMNLSYWGFNQYIIQRALAASSLAEAQKGIAFAAVLKLLMPLIVVLPGIIAYVLLPGLSPADKAYPALLAMLPDGVRGLVFAALLAAVLSSLASMTNSIATIFTLDLYQKLRPACPDAHYLNTGRLVSVLAMVLAVVTARPLLGELDQAFQYIQEFTGFFTPGIVVLFLGGMFWRAMSTAGALAAALGSAAGSLLLKICWPALPFMDRVGLVFVGCILLAVLASLLWPRPVAALQRSEPLPSFTTRRDFNWLALFVCLVLIALYSSWW